jgi:Ca2+-binding RTX toxin-like protein
VITITLTGSHQTIHANNAGDTIFSNDTGNVLYGGTGNDTFHMGRGGDWVDGGGGGDTYDFAAIPWAAGGIIGFDGVLDLGGLLTTTQDIPAGGFSDGYLQLTDDGAGDTQVWARYATSGADSNWWLVTTLDGITTASLDAHHTVVTLSPNAHDVTTSAADYVAPDYVTQINLTGSQQHIDASATNGVFIASNDTGNVLIGGAGNDTFFLGRGGDWVAGGAGADTFTYLNTPWAGGGITDFNAGEGDKIDVSRLLAASGYTGADPFADGYLQLTSDSSGNAQLWSDVHQAGNDGWWLVATLDGVSTSSLHYANGLIT